MTSKNQFFLNSSQDVALYIPRVTEYVAGQLTVPRNKIAHFDEAAMELVDYMGLRLAGDNNEETVSEFDAVRFAARLCLNAPAYEDEDNYSRLVNTLLITSNLIDESKYYPFGGKRLIMGELRRSYLVASERSRWGGEDFGLTKQLTDMSFDIRHLAKRMKISDGIVKSLYGPGGLTDIFNSALADRIMLLRDVPYSQEEQGSEFTTR